MKASSPTYKVADLLSWSALAQRLLSDFPAQRVWLVEGLLGVGKTSFVRAMSRALGVQERVTSPSFGLINTYSTSHGELVYHMDFFRLVALEEDLSFACQECFFSGYYCFVEWPKLVCSLLPEQRMQVLISLDQALVRWVQIKAL